MAVGGSVAWQHGVVCVGLSLSLSLMSSLAPVVSVEDARMPKG